MKPETVLSAPAPITAADKAEYASLDARVVVMRANLAAGGESLGILSDKQLHRAGGFKSFAAYLDERGLPDSLARDLIRAARVVQRLRKPDKPAPLYAQALLFDELEPQQQTACWDELAAKARGPIRTKDVVAAVEKVLGRPLGANKGEVSAAMLQEVWDSMTPAAQAAWLQKQHETAEEAGRERGEEKPYDLWLAANLAKIHKRGTREGGDWAEKTELGWRFFQKLLDGWEPPAEVRKAVEE